MTPSRRTRLQRRRSFGLVLSALAATVILASVPDRPPTPQEAEAERRAHGTRIGLQELTAAIDHYRRDHGALPGRIVAGDLSAEPSAELLVRQLTSATDERGNCVPAPEAGYPFGPYLPGIPVNPGNGLTRVRFLALDARVDGSTGWAIDSSDGTVRSNAEPEEKR